MQEINIRQATPDDVALIRRFIQDLADYEREPDAVLTTDEHIRTSLFGDKPKVFCLIAEDHGKPVGFAVYFFNYSTWLGKHGIYLEDLFVDPGARGLGAGKALLQELAKIAVAKDCGRVEWSVLDWNQAAIDFYRSLGAVAMDEWTVYRLSGHALTQFASAE